MNGHPTREEDFDLYALGALEGEDLAAFESHVATCEVCAGKLAEARGRISMLAFAAPVAQPSPAVKEQLMRRVAADARTRADVPEASRPESARSGAGRPGSGRMDGEPVRGGRASWWGAIFAPAAAALAIAAVLLWVSNSRLNRELDQQRVQLQELKHRTEEVNALLDLATAHDTVSVALNPSPEANGASAHVLYNARMGKLFYSDTMTHPAPPHMSYQLWMVPASGNPISAGLLSPESSGSRMMVTMPPGMAAKAFAVTIEPAGGMPQPTGPKILIGPVS